MYYRREDRLALVCSRFWIDTVDGHVLLSKKAAGSSHSAVWCFVVCKDEASSVSSCHDGTKLSVAALKTRCRGRKEGFEAGVHRQDDWVDCFGELWDSKLKSCVEVRRKVSGDVVDWKREDLELFSGADVTIDEVVQDEWKIEAGWSARVKQDVFDGHLDCVEGEKDGD